MRNDEDELVGIDKSKSSQINMTLIDNQIETLTFFQRAEGIMYPETELPENARKLRGFIWRGDERIRSKDDIFPPEENEYEQKMIEEKKTEVDQENLPLEVRKETLDAIKNKKK
jgi:hypothetical protein